MFTDIYDSKSNVFVQWYRARDLFGSQIPVTTGGF